MKEQGVLVYRVCEIPDRHDPRYALTTGYNVEAAVWAGFEQLIRMDAQFDPASISIALRFFFFPGGAEGNPQERLRLFLLAQAHNEEAAPSLSVLIERGGFRRFYPLEPVTGGAISQEGNAAVCYVVRSAQVLAPTVPREFNAKALPGYLVIHSFEPREENDYLDLDSVLSCIDEPVMIEVCVEPVSVSEQLAASTRYLSELKEIGRMWGGDDDETFRLDWESENRGLLSDSRASIKPLRVKEALVDEVVRLQRRLHEILVRPHLRFQIRVFAQTLPIARLIAGVVAESAFKNGSYQLFASSRGSEFFEETLPRGDNLRVVPPPVLRGLPQDVPFYERLADLVNLAPVEELSSAFRLPLGSYGSPCCIRKNTDPPPEDPENLIVLGWDESVEVGGLFDDRP